jgi:hypothetical protein
MNTATGYILSPNYPNGYPHNITCRYDIIPDNFTNPNSLSIHVTVEELHIYSFAGSSKYELFLFIDCRGKLCTYTCRK